MKTHLLLCNLKTGKVGAYEMFLASFAQALAPDRLLVALAGIDDDAVAKLFLDSGIEVKLIPQWQEEGVTRPWGVVLASLKLLKRLAPETVAVHFGNELPTIVLRVLAWVMGNRSRWIWHQHQQVCNPNRVTRWCNRLGLLSHFMDHFVAVYDGGRLSLEKRGVSPETITVVHNGMIDHKVAGSRLEALRASLGLSTDTSVVLTVGWLVKRKRIDWLLDVWRLVVGRLSNLGLKLLIIGDGPERQRLEHLAQEYGLEDSVEFLGERNDVRDLLAMGDLYAHSAIAETGTYTIGESMCAGIPAVVTDAGAAREQIIDGESGFVAEPDDKSRFFGCLVELLLSPEVRLPMGKAARVRWEERYCLSRCIRPLLELYGASEQNLERRC